jgi:hypothetical protein
MNKDKALKLALEALEHEAQRGNDNAYQYERDAIKAALEAKDEPVAWMFQHEETGRTMCVDAQQLEWGFEKNNPRLKKIAPLYTTPPQRKWVGLTDEEIVLIVADCAASHQHTDIHFARAIEAKLKDKNI